jgi:hypothetical protein
VAIEIAEAVVGALQGELSATAVNAPMVPKEVISFAPFGHIQSMVAFCFHGPLHC